MSETRDSLNGCWILDKSREPWSMSQYLQVMKVDPLAIEAHERGEKENDTFHTIELDAKRVKIVKRSRVNNDLSVDLELGKEKVERLAPGDREKVMLATSPHPAELVIASKLETFNGKASVTDIKTIHVEDGKTYMKQQLTIINEQTNEHHTTTRYFLPYFDQPPHLSGET